jgi:hypothetical protein
MRYVVAAVTLFAAKANAFECTRVKDSSGRETGPSLSWSTRELSYTFFEAGTADIDALEEFEILRASFMAWEDVSACSSSSTNDLEFTERPALSTTDRVGYNFLEPADNENLLIFRDDGWPQPGQEKTIALTTTTYKPLTGEIIDADIEFNSAAFAFSADASAPAQDCLQPSVDCDCDQPPPENCNDAPMDLMNAAVHEIGHYLGLSHEDGVVGATMASRGDAREIEKRDLACDDRDAIVFKYPSGEPNGYCEPTASCGHCAPPRTLDETPDVEVDSRDDGRPGDLEDEGCGCAGGDASLALLALLFRPWGRRRAS